MSLLSSTNPRLTSLGMLFLRIMTGIIFFYAGTGKAFGFFGGYGIKATLEAYRTYWRRQANLKEGVRAGKPCGCKS